MRSEMFVAVVRNDNTANTATGVDGSENERKETGQRATTDVQVMTYSLVFKLFHISRFPKIK